MGGGITTVIQGSLLFCWTVALRAEQKPHTQGNSNLVKIPNTLQKVETRRKNSSGFSIFICGFLGALDLSAVLLYGDDWSTTPSASNCGSPSPLHSAQNKSHTQKAIRIAQSFPLRSAQNKTVIYKKILHFPIAIWYNKSEF